MTHNEILTYLHDNEIAHSLLNHIAVRTVRDVEQALPHLLPTMVKTIAFRLKDGDLILAVVHGQDRVDYKKLAGILGVSRRAVRSLSPEQVLSDLGVEVGGVAPLPLDGARVFVDCRVAEMDVMHTGSGLPTVTLEVLPSEYVAKSDVVVGDLVKS